MVGEPSKGPSTCTNVFGFKEDQVERQKPHTQIETPPNISTRGAPSPELREVLGDT